MLTTTRQQDAVRLLVLLHVAGDDPPRDPPRDDAVASITAESRMQAMDFWLRNPDYLAYELLELYANSRDDELLEKARELVVEEDRHFPVMRFLHGAYTELDGPLMLLRCYDLAWDVRRPPAMSRRRDLYLLQRGRQVLTEQLEAEPDLAWYAERAAWVKRVAADTPGAELKAHQKRLPSYRDIKWGEYIAPVREAVLHRIIEIDEGRAS